MKPRNLCTWLPGAAIACCALWIIFAYSTGAPYADEWGTPGAFLTKMVEEGVTFQDWIAQHNESRKLIPRLLFSAAAFTVGWDPRMFMILSWVLAAGTLVFFSSLCLPACGTAPGKYAGRALMITVTAAILFSPMQSVNQIWGIQFICYVPPFCLALSLWFAALTGPFSRAILIAALCSFIATFTFANGLLLWALAFPWKRFFQCDGATPSDRPRQVLLPALIYAVMAGAAICLYFVGYVKPPYHPPLTYALGHLAQSFEYFLLWVGTPLSGGLPSALVPGAGVVVLIGLVAFSMSTIARYTGRRDVYQIPDAACAAAAFAAYGLASGLITTAGRAGLGAEQAMASRYVTFSEYILLGILSLAWVRLACKKEAAPRRCAASIAISIASVMLVIAIGAGWVISLKPLRDRHAHMRQNLLTLRMTSLIPANPMCKLLYLAPPSITTHSARVLRAHNILHFDDFKWLMDAIKNPAGDNGGWFSVTAPSTTNLAITGWAMNPQTGRPADFVVIARISTNNIPEIITALLTGAARPDVAKYLKNPLLGRTGFIMNLGSQGDESGIKAFAVDERTHRAYSLKPEG